MQKVFVFPAFTSDFTNDPGLRIPGYGGSFKDLVQRAATINPAISFSLPKTTPGTPANAPFLKSPGIAPMEPAGSSLLESAKVTPLQPALDQAPREMTSQLMTYIHSCAAAIALRKLGIHPDLTAGYSMGIYAALFDAGAISFENGIELIQAAHHAILPVTETGSFGMAVVIGLDRYDLQGIIDHGRFIAEISNQNSSHAFVLSGTTHDLQAIGRVASEEGALHFRLMESLLPFHSRLLLPYARFFQETVDSIEISPPRTQLISLIDQTLLTDHAGIRIELVRNLHHPLNWQATLEKIVENNSATLIECGQPTGLARNSKFVQGNFRFYSLHDFVKESTFIQNKSQAT